MPKIIIKTRINAPIEVCFDLARSIDLHQESMKNTDERAIAGVTSGLIGLNESVTWKARHFGMMMKLTSKITAYKFPEMFVDEMVNGPFQTMKHSHVFEMSEGYTLMVDEFEYRSPLGILGKIADSVFLKKYMHSLLVQRNNILKDTAESSTYLV